MAMTDPTLQPSCTVNAGNEHFIASISCLTSDGGDYMIERDVDYYWQEVPGGIEVWAEVNEDFTEFMCGIPEYLKEDIWNQVAERHSDTITEIHLKAGKFTILK